MTVRTSVLTAATEVKDYRSADLDNNIDMTLMRSGPWNHGRWGELTKTFADCSYRTQSTTSGELTFDDFLHDKRQPITETTAFNVQLFELVA